MPIMQSETMCNMQLLQVPTLKIAVASVTYQCCKASTCSSEKKCIYVCSNKSVHILTTYVGKSGWGVSDSSLRTHFRTSFPDHRSRRTVSDSLAMKVLSLVCSAEWRTPLAIVLFAGNSTTNSNSSTSDSARSGNIFTGWILTTFPTRPDFGHRTFAALSQNIEVLKLITSWMQQDHVWQPTIFVKYLM